jgi:sugar (pentulose or hexulose) kinase
MAAAAGVAASPPPPSAIGGDELALGFDFGTSGARCAVVDASGAVVCEPAAYAWGGEQERKQTAEAWVDALHSLLDALPAELCGRVRRIAVSGTSSSVVLCDRRDGTPAAGRGLPRMYDFSVSKQAAAGAGDAALQLIGEHAPPKHTVRSPTSALAKLLAWDAEAPLEAHEVLAHQADFVAAQLCGTAEGGGFRSDWHNALKLGYDVRELRYPAWMEEGPLGKVLEGKLPHVVMPGETMGEVSAAAAARWGLPIGCAVVGGTTDSIAAFLASGARGEGDAVSSLGSTLAVKLLSATPCDDASRGIYSHRLGDLWLVGGASNVGCAVLREQGFDTEELTHLSESIDPLSPPTHTDYYPLPAATSGERFPQADEDKVAVLEPVPEDRAEFLHAILHGVARVEAEGYAALASLGASPLRRVLTSGGGANNPQWMEMRQALLGVPASRAPNTDAAYGAAMLAASVASPKQ